MKELLRVCPDKWDTHHTEFLWIRFHHGDGCPMKELLSTCLNGLLLELFRVCLPLGKCQKKELPRSQWNVNLLLLYHTARTQREDTRCLKDSLPYHRLRPKERKTLQFANGNSEDDEDMSCLLYTSDAADE